MAQEETQLHKGPLWTESKLRPITGEDHLGIKNEAIQMADRLQAGITSITPRARYWAFFSWVLYDFIKQSPDKSAKAFRAHLKRQEWYYVLANYAESKESGIETHQLMGVTKAADIWGKHNGVYPLYDDYLSNGLGGYSIYRNVMKTLGLTQEGNESIGVQIDRLTNKGKEMAEAFQATIEHTEYYRQWRWSEEPVPLAVLIEYGKAAGLSRLEGAHELPLLRELFVPENAKEETNQRRALSLTYYLHLIESSNGKPFSQEQWRYWMYDVFSPRGEHTRSVPDRFAVVAKGWELYQGRQLFTYSLETMWSYVLELLSVRTQSVTALLDRIVNELRSLGLPIDSRLEEISVELPLSISDREAYISDMFTEGSLELENIWNPLLVMLDVADRFRGRDDFHALHVELLNYGESSHISLHKWISDIDRFQERPVVELLTYILKQYVLFQHQQVALAKLITTQNETYHFIEDNGKLQFLAEDWPRFNTFRVLQGVSILEDLGYLKRDGSAWQVLDTGGATTT